MIALVAAGSIGFLSAKGQEAHGEQVYDLQQSIRIASDSSLQAFRSKSLYLSGYWGYKAYKAARLPSLTLNATPIQYRHDIISRYNSDENIDLYREQQTLLSRGNLAVKQNLDLTGGTFSIDTDLEHMRNFGERTYTEFTSTPIRIGYQQSLFGFNNFKWERKIEPLKYKKAQQQYLYSREEISETVIQYYFTLAMAQLEMEMALSRVASSDTLYQIGMERQKIASISQEDLLTLKLDAVNARNALMNAESSLKRAKFNFLSFLNQEQEQAVKVQLPKKPENLLIRAEEALWQARENNPDFVDYQQQILEAERQVEQTRKESNFNASINASVGFNQVAETFANVYQNPSQQEIVRIGLTIPLIDWGIRKGRSNMARYNMNVTKISVEQRRQSLEQDVIMTVNDFNIQQNLIASAEEARELASMAYEVTKSRFIIGKTNLNNMMLSLERQNTAQRNYINSLRAYWASLYKLRRLTLYDFETNEPLTTQFDRIERVKN